MGNNWIIVADRGEGVATPNQQQLQQKNQQQ